MPAGRLVRAEDSQGCRLGGLQQQEGVQGAILLLHRGSCMFTDKVGSSTHVTLPSVQAERHDAAAVCPVWLAL